MVGPFLLILVDVVDHLHSSGQVYVVFLNELLEQLQDDWECVHFPSFCSLASLSIISIPAVYHIHPWVFISGCLIPTIHTPHPILDKLAKQSISPQSLFIDILLHDPQYVVHHRLLTDLWKSINVFLRTKWLWVSVWVLV